MCVYVRTFQAQRVSECGGGGCWQQWSRHLRTEVESLWGFRGDVEALWRSSCLFQVCVCVCVCVFLLRM
uniref:Uncharacterized protein n=1 Tax=Physcomitrium patens TaxID=3218 RepID=A0A2K1IIQ5_PHYPA|nr:hypothetical protein PHYPA_027846 [Physcomitrium patens]